MSRAFRLDLSARDQRTLGVGAVVILALFLSFRAIPAWLAWVRDRRAAAAELVARTAAARATVHATLDGSLGHHATDSLVRLRRALQPALVNGATPARAGAALASLLADQAGLASVQLDGVELVLDTAARGGAFSRPRVRATVTGDVRSVLRLLFLLETNIEPVLAIRRITITAADPAAPADRAEVLRASLDVEGIVPRGGQP